jgi:leader peptidase (prepilin peptidase) / N-methyltransferase
LIAAWIAFPIELRLLLVAVFGLLAGSLANHVIYTFAYFKPRPISPWRGGVPVSHRIPVLGWLNRGAENETHGRGFWIRPLLIEIAVPASLVTLYLMETRWGMLFPQQARDVIAFLGANETDMTIVFGAHALLFVLMIAATFIDFDERTIPDIITVPGTILGLTLASMSPNIFMPTCQPGLIPAPTTFDSPWFVPDSQWWANKGLVVAYLIWSGWCFALADRRWSGVLMRRRGIGRAIEHFFNALFHYPRWKQIVAMWVMGLIAIGIVYGIGGRHWHGAMSGLVGLAVGGGVLWAIRIIGSVALRVEAMGFGDVTLMAMIGAFVGWQAALLSFFLAPFAAILIVITQWLLTGDKSAPFGPYLCAGTLGAICGWDRLYNAGFSNHLLVMGSFLLGLGLAMLGLMGVMLWTWRLFKERFLYSQ